MAPVRLERSRAAPRITSNEESDYGSDFGTDDEATLSALINTAESQPIPPVVVSTIEDEPDLTTASQPIYKQYVDEDGVLFQVLARDGPIRAPSVEVEYDTGNRVTFSPARNSPAPGRQRSASAQPDESRDARSPLERFRSRRPMSVTDLVSPAWCELQYFYSLSKYGRVRKTPAMKQGSEVHKVLEEQVHTAVPVDIVSKEDGFGLRLWNIIQGLRTLRVTGMTREMEVWGVLEGQVVNGVIDELSFQCPDEELQKKILEKQSSGEDGRKKQKLSPNQRTMDTFLSTQDSKTPESTNDAWSGSPHAPTKKVYLTDIKTRGSRSIPNTETALRGTSMQLMLYHNLLSLMASNSVPADKVFERYKLDSSAAFSDTFIAQIAGLDFNFRENAAQDGTAAPFENSEDSMDELLAHNTLEKLWTLVIAEFQKTLPLPPSQLAGGAASPIGDVLRAEFRTPGSGDVIGVKTFAFDAAALDRYVKKEMAWWCGERGAVGVDIEEAFKCRICEFAEKCTWRKDKVDEGLKKARLRREARKRSEV